MIGKPNTSSQHHAERRPAKQPNEGEGSRTAAQRYNQGVQDTVRSGKLAEGARKAREAIEGPEAEELARAEEEGMKKPPRSTPARPASH